MRALFHSLFAYFLTPSGLVLMGVLDGSVVFFLPLGIDFVVIILAARRPDLFWEDALLAAIGSTIGAALTFWIGRQIGQHGLSRLVRPSRLSRVKERVSRSAAVTVAALAVIPPPFPFTAFVLTSGALNASAGRFLTTLGAVRLLRFGIEGGLAAYYGRGILGWMESTTFTVTVGVVTAVAVIGTILSAIAVIHSTRVRQSVHFTGRP